MMLQDEGKLSVEEPVQKYLPEFKNQMLIESKSSNSVTLVAAPRPITIRDLLTHTSGLGDVPAPRSECTLAELAMAYSQKPLMFAPGTKWSYSNQGINTLGRIIEVVSGMPYADLLAQRIFKPIGMHDTTFWPTAGQIKRLAKSYQPAGDGKGLEETDIFFIKTNLMSHARTAYPSGGLFSTAQDYFRFCQMVLNGGEWHGKRLLAKEWVTAMTRTQTGEIKTGFVDGMSFGFGFAVVKEPKGITTSLSQGTFGHGGAYGTQAWVDPAKDTVLVLMIQRAKLPNADASEVRRVFQDTAMEKFGK
jgi:CubicO group peptidase (beta-lactamase class C family)